MGRDARSEGMPQRVEDERTHAGQSQAIGQNAGNPFKEVFMGGKMRDEAERAVQLDPNYIEPRFMLIDL